MHDHAVLANEEGVVVGDGEVVGLDEFGLEGFGVEGEGFAVVGEEAVSGGEGEGFDLSRFSPSEVSTSQG